MTTATQLITRSMRLMRAIGVTDTPPAEEINDGLVALNNLLDSLWNERLMVYTHTESTFALTAGDGAYTIGTGGDINVSRPIDIRSAYVRYGTVDYQLEQLADEDYEGIPIKNISGIPSRYYYEQSFPLGTLHLFPYPVGAMTLYYSVPKRLESFATVNEDVDLPPGYEDMLAYQLAVHYAPEYGMEPSPTVVAMARDKKAILKRKNTRQPMMKVDSALTGGAGYNYHIPPT